MIVNYISKKSWLKLSVIISVLSLLFACESKKEFSSKQSLEALKPVIALRDYYLEKKLNRIDSVQKILHLTTNPVVRFDACRTLFQEYYDLQIDSALRYAQQMLELSEGNLKQQPIYQTEAQLFIARVYAYSGMYKESSKLLEDLQASVAELPKDLKRLYFMVHMELYKGLADQTISKSDLETYKKTIAADRDFLLALTAENSVWNLMYLSNKIKEEGDYDHALSVLFKAYNQLTTEDRDMAHVAFHISQLYRKKGDIELEKQYLVVSIIADIKHAVKEYASLWTLATILYDEGDMETAYQFIEISLQDAMYSGAYRWTQYIIRILPDIYTGYNATILKQKNTISSALFAIVFLLGCSILLSIYIVKQYRKLNAAKSQLSKMNEELKTMNEELTSLSNQLHLTNEELQVNNRQLVFLNNELVTTDLLKETYLSKFIDLCSDYIEKLDDYRGNVRRLLKGGKIEKIEKELGSTKYIEEVHKSFLMNFDDTFLTLYPNFTSEFNSLFPKDDQLQIKENELLTTELRIFALIRLGIVDSNKIAKFLRCSITTIYTYRSKVKNRSFYPTTFEERIKEYQKQSHSSPLTE